MAVAWYRMKILCMLKNNDPTLTRVAARVQLPLNESWTVYDNITGIDANGFPTGDDTPVTRSIQILRYPGCYFTFAYDQDMVKDPDTHLIIQIPTMSLVRAESTRMDPATITEGTLLDTEAKWNYTLNNWPTLSGRFADQPYN